MSLLKIIPPSIMRIAMYKTEAYIPVTKPLFEDFLAQKKAAVKPERR